ncbi:MAG: hypothetical protein E6K53_01330 [Gammaproteobacteria bacterium]|nr:MAG: hypothetical protein E6K53_01330 [Gammaproteobacteria bacterium]
MISDLDGAHKFRPVRKGFALLVLACLVSLVSASALAQLTLVPTQINQFDVETTITLGGVSPGTDSTMVTFTQGADVVVTTVDASLVVAIPGEVAANAGSWSVTVIATDLDSTVRNYGPATLTVVAPPTTIPPQLPEIVVAEATSPTGANVTFDVGDAACDHSSGDLFPLGTTTVNCGAAGAFQVVVTDTTSPVITVPGDFATASNNPTFTVTATDNIDGAEPASNISCSPASGATFPNGVTTVLCSAHDAHFNYAFGSFNINVGVPILHLPDPITAEATSPAGAVVTYTATADGADTFSCSPASGSTFPLGTTTVNCTATNAAGTSTGSFTVKVQDTTPPAINSITASPNNLWPDDHKMVNVTLTVSATDLVDPSPTATIVSVTANQPLNSPGSGNTSPDFVITGNLTLQLRAERTQGVNRTYTITVRVCDFSGNCATGTVTATVSPPPGS